LDVWREVYNSLKDKHDAVSQEIDNYCDQLLRYLRDSGRISSEQYIQIKDKNPFYVPMYRVINEDIPNVKGIGTKKLEQLYNPVKHMKGSTLDVYDPIESIIYNTFVIISVAERQRVSQALVDLAKKPGMGKLIWKRSMPVKPVQMTLEEALREITRIFNIPKESIESLGFSKEDLQKILTTFRPNIAKGPNDVLLFNRGKPELYEVPTWLSETLSAADSRIVYKFPELLQWSASLLRAGATAYNPEFGVKNPFTDQLTAFLFSKNLYIPGYDAIKGLAHILKADKIWQLYNASGAAYADFVSMDRRFISKKFVPQLFHDIFKGADLKNHPLRTFFHTVSNPLEFLREATALSEEATRIADFELSLRRYAAQRAEKNMSWLDVLAQSGLDTRNVTQDFNRMGLKARAINTIVAFFGANVGGNLRLWEGLTSKEEANFFGMPMQQRYKVMLGGMLAYTIPSLLLFFAQRDDPYYQEIPPWRRMLCFNIILHNDDGTLKHIISLPRKFLPGLLFGALPEMFLNYMYKKDKRLFYKSAMVLLDNIMPPLVPNFALAPTEWVSNRKFFFDRRIVPQGMEKLPAYLQAGPYTSQAVQLLCKAIVKLPGVEEGISPAKLDEAIRTMFGGVGSHVLAATDMILNLLGLVEGIEPPNPTLADMPVIKAFVQRMPTGAMNSLQEFWDELGRMEKQWEGTKHRAGLRGLGERIPVPDKLKYFQGHAERIRMLNRLALLVRDAKNMSGEQKRAVLDRIAWASVDIARHAMDKEPLFTKELQGAKPWEMELPDNMNEKEVLDEIESAPDTGADEIPFVMQ